MQIEIQYLIHYTQQQLQQIFKVFNINFLEKNSKF